MCAGNKLSLLWLCACRVRQLESRGAAAAAAAGGADGNGAAATPQPAWSSLPLLTPQTAAPTLALQAPLGSFNPSGQQRTAVIAGGNSSSAHNGTPRPQLALLPRTAGPTPGGVNGFTPAPRSNGGAGGGGGGSLALVTGTGTGVGKRPRDIPRSPAVTPLLGSGIKNLAGTLSCWGCICAHPDPRVARDVHGTVLNIPLMVWRCRSGHLNE